MRRSADAGRTRTAAEQLTGNGEQTRRAHEAKHEEHNNGAARLLSPAIGTRSASSARSRLTIGYYIDTLTVVMFCMVTLIASCIHFYAIGYMHDELHDVTDHEVTLADGHHLHRRGRFHRFFQYLSLFCFSMLGLVHRRQHRDGVRVLGTGRHLLLLPDRLLHRAARAPATAANKAFIVNRVGDFGMIIGLMALWSTLGTFYLRRHDRPTTANVEPGIFSQLHDRDEQLSSLRRPTA